MFFFFFGFFFFEVKFGGVGCSDDCSWVGGLNCCGLGCSVGV